MTLPFKTGLNYFARFLPGGRESMIDLARLSDREKVRSVALQYDEMGAAKRAKIPIEELCQTVDLSPADFISAVVGVAYSVNMDIAKLISSLAHPDIIKAAVDKAVTPEGFADRRMLLTASEFLPKPSGIQVTQNNRNVAAAQARADSNGPSFEEIIRQSAEAVRR